MTRTPTVSMRVVEKIAERKGISPEDLDIPLHDVLDPDALDSLFANDGAGKDPSSGQVEFSYEGHKVLVDASGEVSATEQVIDHTPGSSAGSESIAE